MSNIVTDELSDGKVVENDLDRSSNSPSPDIDADPPSKGSSVENDGEGNQHAESNVEEHLDHSEQEEGESESGGETKEDKTKIKPKKTVFLNVFLRCTSESLLGDSTSLQNFLEENELDVKDVQPSNEPCWIRFGQIELEKGEGVEKAMALSGKELSGHEVRVERARGNTTDRIYAPDECILFIRNLTKSVTEEVLHTLFPKAKEVRLPKKNGKNRGFAFINFATKKEVDELIRDRQSENYDGKPMKLGPYTSKDQYGPKKNTKVAGGSATKKSPSTRNKSGRSAGGRGRTQYSNQYSRYNNQIQPLLDIDTSTFRNRGARDLRDFDEYGYYHGDYALDYLYDLHSRMGLESGMMKRMGQGYGDPYRMNSDLFRLGNLGYGQRYQGQRGNAFGYGNQGGYMDGFRQSERKRSKSGGNKQTKGKSGWPAK